MLVFHAGQGHPTRMHAETDVETALLGPVLADRTCGTCTACCTVLTVDTPEFKKPAGTPCVHLSAGGQFEGGQSEGAPSEGGLSGGGCRIHDVRPRICRTWFCAWRRVAAMPDAARPDRSGLIVSVTFVKQPQNCFEAVSITVRTLAGSDAIGNGMAAVVLDSVCDRLVPVWFSDGSRKMLLHPENDVAALVISGEPAPAHLQDEVGAWRERYGVFVSND